jgi:SHAQKYF class myb-like DNA-binding protein
MFAVARVVQDKISTKHQENKTTIQAQPQITPKPKEVKPRFLISDSKTLIENANQQENQNREKKKIKVRLSIIKDTSREQASSSGTSIITPFSTIKDGSQNEKKFKKGKDVKLKLTRRREGNFHCGRWQQDEHQRFIEAILKYGNEWKLVQKHVGTRSSTQARSHAQKFFVKIKKSNLFDFNVDFSKNSIKSLHSLATNLTADEYINAIKALNCVAFERKQHSLRRKQRRDDVMSATDSFFNDGFSSTMNTNTINLK